MTYIVRLTRSLACESATGFARSFEREYVGAAALVVAVDAANDSWGPGHSSGGGGAAAAGSIGKSGASVFS